MGAFFKIFIALLCMNVMLSIAFPGSQTQFLEDNFFTQLLTVQTDPLTNETYYNDVNPDLNPQWSEGGNEESGFLQKFIDALSVIKTFAITMINIAVVPLVVAIRMQMPVIIKLLVFVPLSILYIIAAIVTLIRGVNP